MANPYYGGGGFNTSPYGAGGGSQPGSQGSPGGKGKGGSSTLRPVTIKQIQNATQSHADADFSIDGVDIGNVSIVGVIRNISNTATNVSYQIEDGTGYIDARLWLDTSSDDNGKTEGIEQDIYVAVMGSLKSFGGKRHVSAQSVRPITDHNEVFYHLLESLYISLSLRNPDTTRSAAPGASKTNGGAATSDYNAGAQGNGGADTNRWSQYPDMHRRVLQAVHDTDDVDGAHVAGIARTVGGDGAQIMEAIEYLITEGELFTTVDDFHVKCV